MPSPRDIRRRIKSVTSTAQITKAMQMVAASKMRKAQQAALDDAALCAAAVPHPAPAPRRTRSISRHPLLEVREVRKRAVILSARTRACAARSTATCSAWPPSSTRRPPCSSPPGKRAAQFIARTRRQLVAEFTYHGLAALRRGQAIADVCPRPVFEGRGGPGPGRRHAVHQHAHPASRSAVEFLPIGEIKGLKIPGRGIRSGVGRRHRPSSCSSPARKPSWAISFRITSTSTSTRSCWMPRPASKAPAWWP